MKSSAALILSFSALVVGLIAGAGIASAVLLSSSAHYSLVSTEVQLLQNLHVLKDLQAGRLDEAKEMLEQRIDLGVVHLDFLKKEHKQLQKESFSSLPAVAEYRSRVPRVSQEDRVTRILDAVKK